MDLRELTFFGLAFFLPVSSFANPTKSQARCEMSQSDHAWIQRAIRNWTVAQPQLLHLAPTPLPTIVAIDESCTYVAAHPKASSIAWKSSPHAQTVVLPDGKKVPVGLISFAAPITTGADTGYFAISLPSMWRKRNVQSALGVEPLVDGVFLHEMTHTRQFYFANPSLEALTKRYGLPDNIGDDSLQEAFSNNKDYVADYERERDLLYSAALSASNAEARQFARQALAAMRARRDRWFRGENEKWRDLDEIFLTMEGLGQWVMYAWYTGPSGLHLSRESAINFVRRKRQWWTQDEGLAIFLVVDRLLPDWQSLAFAPEPVTAEGLLERATK